MGERFGMLRQWKWLAAIPVLVGLMSSAILSANASPPPVQAFGKRPMISDVVISPGGTHYAAVQWLKGKEIVAIYNLYGKTKQERVKFFNVDIYKDFEEKVRSISWLNDETVGVAIGFEASRFGVPTMETRLIAVRADLSDIRRIPKPKRPTGKNQQTQRSREGQFQDHILDFMDSDPDRILMQLDIDGYGQELNVYEVKVKNGAIRSVVKGGRRVADYLVDQQGRVRLRTSIFTNGKSIEFRLPESRQWQTLLSMERDESFEFVPVAFAKDPNILLVSDTNSEGFETIREYDLVAGEVGDVAHSVSGADVDGVATDRYTRAVTGYAFSADYPSVHYEDEMLKSLQAALDRVLPDTQNAIVNYDRARNMFVVFASGPRHPGTYYIYVRSKGQLTKVLDRNAIPVDPADLGDMKPIAFTARDGKQIPAYLTLPKGNAPYPMVVMPHGGPTSRDYLVYDYQVQFLASRGYAVLQPNFRGSSGFGRKFQRAGYGQWGLLMQDDVTDGTNAMIEQGIADPERICIVGSSYGGYAALMGAVVTPDLYKCAVSFAGVTDILRMISEDKRYKFSTDNPPNVGHRKDDHNQLRDTSPIKNIDAITVPILLIHGDKDLAVSVDHSKRMAWALKKAKKPHKLVILKDGNHYLQLEKHRMRFLQEVEGFLAENIGR